MKRKPHAKQVIRFQSPWTAIKIKNFRKTYGLTQDQIAEMLGCRQQTISEWEMAAYTMGRAYTKLFDQATDDFLAGRRLDQEMAHATA